MANLKGFILIALVGVAVSQSVIQLEQYNINPDTITVSGLSAGGAYATQFHVIYSSELMGAAIFAGLVYHCANGILGTALICMSSPYLTNVNSLIRKTDDLASEGKIDDTTGMAGDKVYILAGTEDSTVRPANGPLIEEFYENYGSEIFTNFDIEAEHCQPTDNYGPACTYNGGEFINDCDYDGAYEALNYLYGNSLIRPDDTVSLDGLYSQYDQGEFFGGKPSADSMDDVGFIYVPSGCVDKTQTCHLHVVFHGCKQGREFLDDVFVTKTQYLETAEVNNIIMIFPQIIKTSLSNPNGCWDWWGYTGIYKYVNNEGPQNIGVRAMIQRLVNGA